MYSYMYIRYFRFAKSNCLSMVDLRRDNVAELTFIYFSQ